MRVSVVSISGREPVILAADPSWDARAVLEAMPQQGAAARCASHLFFGTVELCGSTTLADIGAGRDSVLTLVIDHLKASAQELLWSSPHSDGCDEVRSAEVTRVQVVDNPALRQAYDRKKNSIREAHAQQSIECEPLRPAVAPGLQAFCRAMGVGLEPGLNEELLMTGTSSPEKIAQEGFMQPPTRGFYGNGLYFADLSCKCHGHSRGREGCLVLARAVLGNVADAGELAAGRRLLEGAGGGLYDSLAASDGFSVRGRSRSHREYIVFDAEQACPEFLIFYRMPDAAR